jgi:hypothetical protein
MRNNECGVDHYQLDINLSLPKKSLKNMTEGFLYTSKDSYVDLEERIWIGRLTDFYKKSLCK